MSTNALRAPEVKLWPETLTPTKQEAQRTVTICKRLQALFREIFEGREEYLGLTPD